MLFAGLPLGRCTQDVGDLRHVRDIQTCRHAQVSLDPFHRAGLVRGDEADDHSGGSGPGSAARAVHVVLGVRRRIEVDHRVHPVDVDPTSGHVGGDQRIDRTLDK